MPKLVTSWHKVWDMKKNSLNEPQAGELRHKKGGGRKVMALLRRTHVFALGVDGLFYYRKAIEGEGRIVLREPTSQEVNIYHSFLGDENIFSAAEALFDATLMEISEVENEDGGLWTIDNKAEIPNRLKWEMIQIAFTRLVVDEKNF